MYENRRTSSLFLGELKTTKRHFKMNWPLNLLQNIRLKQNAKKMRMIQSSPVRRFQCQRFIEEMCTGLPKDQRGQDFT